MGQGGDTPAGPGANVPDVLRSFAAQDSVTAFDYRFPPSGIGLLRYEYASRLDTMGLQHERGVLVALCLDERGRGGCLFFRAGRDLPREPYPVRVVRDRQPASENSPVLGSAGTALPCRCPRMVARDIPGRRRGRRCRTGPSGGRRAKRIEGAEVALTASVRAVHHPNQAVVRDVVIETAMRRLWMIERAVAASGCSSTWLGSPVEVCGRQFRPPSTRTRARTAISVASV